MALAALRHWGTSQQLADHVVGGALGKSRLAGSDRAFVMELFYGVLRNRTLLDFWIRCLRQGRIDAELRDLLRIGLYQLLIARISPHAAVNETVELAAKKHRAIANAILRNASRQHEELLDQAKTQPLYVRWSHPEFLLERWDLNFGADVAAELCRWNNEPPPLYGRINQLKISPEQFLLKYRSADPVAGTDNFVVFSEFPQDALDRGECYLQDPSTRLACELLMVRPNDRVLDACAAPGGKAAYLAELMQNKGTIVACDRSSDRLKAVGENVRRLGASIVTPMEKDWLNDRSPAELNAAAPFDAVMVDAPCTNTGVMRRRVDVRWRLRPDDFERMADEQTNIVSAVLPLLKTKGALVYSTCSLEPEENDTVVARIVAAAPDLIVEEERRSLPWRHHFDGAFAVRLRKR